MDKDIKADLKRKRKKRNNKRWTDNEIKQLVKYLQEQEEFEKPTAQVFYRKFLKHSNLDATWDLCRWKIKNLRTTYKKAEIWRKSNGLLGNDPAVKDTLRKMCRFYDELHGVFAKQMSNLPDEDSTMLGLNNRANAADSAVYDSIYEYFQAAVKTEENDVIEDHVTAAADSIDEYLVAAVEPQENASIQDQAPLLVPLRSANCCSPISSLAAGAKADVQRDHVKTKETVVGEPTNYVASNERHTLLKMRFDFEKEKFRKEFELKELKFQEEIKERRENFELRKLEMEKDERLRILELEKQERIERFEIEMRYRD